MKSAPKPDNEQARLNALREYGILDTDPERAYNDLVKLVKRTLHVPAAYISLIDEHRQWLKAEEGLNMTESDRDIAFCAHTILSDEPMVIEDTFNDERFADNPFVTGNPGIRFYAGVPLKTPGGLQIGTICAVDFKPRMITPYEIETMKILGRNTVSLLELRKANLILSHSFEQRVSFMSAMTHDIRSMINGILGHSEYLLTRSKLSDYRDELSAIFHAGRSIIHLVNDILDMGRIEDGQLELVNSTFNLKQVVNTAVSTFQGEAANKGINLKISEPDEKLPENLIGDPFRIEQILINLVANAVKFTDHGSVTVAYHGERLSLNRFRLKISVIDTGPGIAADVQTVLFQKYAGDTGDKARKYGSSGLGLYIVKKLTDLMNGEISLTSPHPPGSDSGTCFTLALPLPVPAAETETATGQKTVSQPAGSEGARQISILVAEDEHINQIVLKNMLQSLGYHFIIVGNGAEALKEFASNRYDLILLDNQMPIMTGNEAAEQIREKNASIPIISMTGTDSDEVPVFYSDRLKKPYQRDELSQIIEKNLPQQ